MFSDFGLPNTRRQSCKHTNIGRLQNPVQGRGAKIKTIPYPAALLRIAHIGENRPPPGKTPTSVTVVPPP